MIAILKIRLSILKRHYIKAFFICFLPSLLIIFFSWLGKLLVDEDNNKEGKSHYDQIKTINFDDSSIGYFFSDGDKTSIVTISENETISQQNLNEIANKIIESKCDDITNNIFFNNMDEYDDYYDNEYEDQDYKIMVMFQMNLDEKNDIIYKLKDNIITLNKLGQLKNRLSYKRSDDNDDGQKNLKYIIDRFLIAQEIFIEYNKCSKLKLTIESLPMKTRPLLNPFSDENLSSLIGMYLALCYLMSFSDLLDSIVEEKQKKLNLLLFRQGITIINYYLSWFVYFLCVHFIPLLICSFIINFVLFYHNNFFIPIFFSLFLFEIQLFSYVFFITIFINKDSSNGLMKSIFIILSLLGNYILDPNVNYYLKLILLCFPNINLIANFNILILIDNFEVGLDKKLFFTKNDSLSLFNIIVIQIISIILMLSIGIIIICFKEGILSFSKENEEEEIGTKISIDSEDDKHLTQYEINHEEITETNQKLKSENNYLNIKNVYKIFGDVKAVNNFNGEIFNNEIFCLLGHNGAGKTTLISMISGILDVDEGDIELNGISLIKNKKYLYENIGLCTQEDLFFKELTVKEHLIYMSELKGKKANNIEINDLINRLDLTDKADDIADHLSGGQKRKLCIALALIGKSKLILLDEPTSGMDVIAKKQLWEFLKNYKDDRILILTTHSLDEAEYLGDRIGIMNEGRYICSGTSSYLKSKYPCGFNINILIDSKKSSSFKRMELYNHLRNIDNSAEVKIESKGVYSINFSNINDNIIELFRIIDENKNNCGIENYTVSTTTLEDVFLKLNDKNFSQETKKLNSEISNNEIKNENVIIENRNFINYNKQAGCFKQIYDNTYKNLIPLWRNKSVFIIEILTGLLLITFYLAINDKVQSTLSVETLNYNKLFQYDSIYYGIDGDESEFDWLINSDFVKNNKVEFKKLEIDSEKKGNISLIDEWFYKQSKYKNEKSFLYFKKENDRIRIYNLYREYQPEYFVITTNMILNEIYKNKSDTNNYFSIFDTFSGIKDDVKISEIRKIYNLFVSINSVIMVWISFNSFISNMIKTPISNRINNIKHLLFLSGENIYAYWIGNLIIDFIKFLIYLFCLMLILVWFSNMYWYSLIILICFFFPTIFIIYSFSYILDNPNSGLTFCNYFFNFIGIGLIAVDFIIGYDPTKTNFKLSISDIFPCSCLFMGLLKLSIFYELRKLNLNKIWTVIGYQVITYLIQVVFYIFIFVGFELRLIPKLFNYILFELSFKQYDLNDNIMIESSNEITNIEKNSSEILDDQNKLSQNLLETNNNIIIKSTNNNAENLIPKTNEEIGRKYIMKEKQLVLYNSHLLTTVINNVSKTFFNCCKKNNRAVRNLYLGLEPNEKFGLLGFNGSGKSTTFKCITNQILYDMGNITLFKLDNKRDFELIRKSIGYCPQENPLFDYSSVNQTINYFRSLKGVTESADNIIERFGLKSYKKTLCKNLSGGNKRKLTFAIALMGSPNLILLDEPSSAVDPESRRGMWKNINKLSNSGKQYNMILTTHSMEEAEVLCDTVSWFKSGNFMCIGNPEKLKIEFSIGYTIHIKFINDSNNFSNDSIVDNQFYNLIIVDNKNREIFDHNENNINFYANKLITVLNEIKDYCENIKLKHVNKDNSFEIIVNIIQANQGELFSKILNMKNINNEVSEISINTESLEDILTKFS